jgi:hypothetical protein
MSATKTLAILIVTAVLTMLFGTLHPPYALADDTSIVGSWVNGIKLASDLLVYQLLTQCLPGFDHQREALGSPLLDARLHPMGADGVHDQRSEWHASMWRTEPPQRVEEADPLHADTLQGGGVPHDQADQVINDGKHRQFFQHAWHGFAVQHIHLHGGLEMCQRGLDVIVTSHKIRMVRPSRVAILQRTRPPRP